jgi:catechol 2,3-dioxygenase-like lactoylglutathione lyase family enzyme
MTKPSTLSTAKAACFVCTADRARAKAFYEGTLGLALVHEDNFALVFDSNGTTLRVSPAKDFKPQPFTVMGWEVKDIKATVTALTAAGIAFVRVPGLTQDDLGIWSPAAGVFIAWFKDPDGNMLSVGQH